MSVLNWTRTFTRMKERLIIFCSWSTDSTLLLFLLYHWHLDFFLPRSLFASSLCLEIDPLTEVLGVKLTYLIQLSPTSWADSLFVVEREKEGGLRKNKVRCTEGLNTYNRLSPCLLRNLLLNWKSRFWKLSTRKHPRPSSPVQFPSLPLAVDPCFAPISAFPLHLCLPILMLSILIPVDLRGVVKVSHLICA